MNVEEVDDSEIMYFGFNDQGNEFTIACAFGFRSYISNPFRIIEKHDIGCISAVSQFGLSKDRLFCVVNREEDCKLNIFTDGKWTREETFGSKVIKILPSYPFFAVVESQRISVLSDSFQKLLELETIPNPGAICSFCHDPDDEIMKLAYPDIRKGHVTVHFHFYKKTENASVVRVIACSETTLRTWSISPNGDLLATCSKRGTMVRIFSIQCDDTFRQKMFEFRRGSFGTTIYCLKFSRNGEYLLQTSKSGTLHLFSLRHERSKGIVKYAMNEKKSIGRFKDLVNLKKVPHIATFLEPVGNSVEIGVLTGKGKYLIVKFDLSKFDVKRDSFVEPSNVQVFDILKASEI